MAKDKKKNADAKKAKKAEKAAKQANKGEKKAKNKAAKVEGSDAEDVDLDEVLEEYRRQQEQFLKITETVIDAPPRARAASTLMASPHDSNTLLLFGGEYFNGSLAQFFNDLNIYNINRDEWRCSWKPEPRLSLWRGVLLAKAGHISPLLGLLEAGACNEGVDQD
ncbi:hypothetical protein LW94_5799 [Fusarium fujikuroi]|nr:hypothetical protein LW94_5799 [Fusarium fujikuroi]